jgi:glc operon protein GlcG
VRKAIVVCCLFSARAVLAQSATVAVAPSPELTVKGARQVLELALARGRELHTTGAIAIVDRGGALLVFERLEGTFPAAAAVAAGKARTAATFQRPTRIFEDAIAKGRVALTAMPDFTPLQGGVPLMLDGQTVGAIGVSGAASAQQDEELAQAAANAAGLRVETVAKEQR